MDKMYLVIESSGEYDDFRRHVCLATPALEVAESFKESFEKVRDEYKDILKLWVARGGFGKAPRPAPPQNKYVAISGGSTFGVVEIPYLEETLDANLS